MTKFNRRAFMSVAGIAAAETAFSPLVSARTNRSDAPATLTGNGEWTYEVVPGWVRSCPSWRICRSGNRQTRSLGVAKAKMREF